MGIEASSIQPPPAHGTRTRTCKSIGVLSALVDDTETSMVPHRLTAALPHRHTPSTASASGKRLSKEMGRLRRRPDELTSSGRCGRQAMTATLVLEPGNGNHNSGRTSATPITSALVIASKSSPLEELLQL
eukprot:scaffold163553_cov29-Tisochrysis_lutea.AAC.1